MANRVAWNMDTGTSSHLDSHTSESILPTLNSPLHLHNVQVTPNIIKSLIYVSQFTKDNNYTVEFDAFGFSVKDFLTHHILLRCDSSGDLYPVTSPFLLLMLCFVYKARLVANRHSQQFGDDTFTPVVKPATVCILFSLALSRNWPIHQLDVKNVILNADLSKTMYMYQSPGFVDARFPQHMCRLQRSLYGLKQAPHTWFQCFVGYANKAVDTESKLGSDGDPISDPTLYRSHAAKRQHTHSRSSVEAEYRDVANVVVETAWLHNLLRELHTLLFSTTLVYCDNVSAIYITANPVQHQRTKYIEIDIHFVRDMVARAQLRVLYVPSRY
nr:ribonuclease H-like domain-containing protein [Tanacetum cinerariifolium]